MATVREIRAKLNSVRNIKKITQALEMVAASRLRKALAKVESSRPFANVLKEILGNLLSSTDPIDHLLITKREVKKVGFVIIAADRGLCGGYNQAVYSAAEKELKKYDPAKVDLMLIGRKAVEHFSGKQWNVVKAVSEWGGKITYSEIDALTRQLIDEFSHGRMDEIWMVYTHYIGLSERKVVVDKLLNIDPTPQTKKGVALNYIFEPNIEEVARKILPHYCVTMVQTALNEAYAAELAARVLSMRAATSNAEEMIEDLTLTRNKVRQSGITREIIEITAGAQSLQ